MDKIIATFLALTLWAGDACAADYTYTPTTRDRADMQVCLGVYGDAQTCAVQIVKQTFDEETVREMLYSHFSVGRSNNAWRVRQSPQSTAMIGRAIAVCGMEDLTALTEQMIAAGRACLGNEAQKIGYAIGAALARDAMR